MVGTTDRGAICITGLPLIVLYYMERYFHFNREESESPIAAAENCSHIEAGDDDLIPDGEHILSS